MKKKENNIITIVIIICLIIGVFIASYFFISNKEKPNDNVNKINYEEEMREITDKNNLALNMYSDEIEFLNTISYEDLLSNLVDLDKIVEGTKVKILLNNVELTPEEDIIFNEVGEFTIETILTKDYEYDNKTEKLESSKINTIIIKDTIFPVLSGVSDKTITVGDKIDILSGITATDEKEGTLEVSYDGKVDTSKAGTYTIKIYAVDKNGNRTEKDMKVTVKAKTTSSSGSSSSSSSSSGSSSSSKPSTGSTSSSSSTNCKYTTTLQKRGYNKNDKDACQKDKEATAVVNNLASQIKAKGYKTDLEKVQAAASIVADYYVRENHVESGYDYRTPYGLFVKREASCAGTTRALIQLLEALGFKNLTHANANSWTHQWVILTMDGQVGYADGQVGWVDYGEHPLA